MSALPVPILEPFDIEDGIREALSAEIHDARRRQAFSDDLHRAVESSRLFDKLAASHDYDLVMLSLAADARASVNTLFDRRPSQVHGAEQTMRSV